MTYRETRQKWFVLIRAARLQLLLTTLLIMLSPAVPVRAQPYQGFGGVTSGGAGQTIYNVTNLDDSGTGSLRDALSAGNRYIRFDVAGDILLRRDLRVLGANVTIDGFTAPEPGVTLRNAGLNISGNRGAHDVIVRGIRVRDASDDGIQIIEGAYNVVIDQVSIHGSRDGNLDIGTGAHDITVSWSIFAATKGNMLIKYDPSRITLHHNLFTSSLQRNPQVRIDNAGTPATDTTVDMRNNLIWDWGGGSGTLIWFGPWANIVDNFYASNGGDAEDALIVSDGARAYVADNFSLDGVDVNAQGTEAIPFSAPSVDTTDACSAAHQVVSFAGVSPRDAVDEQYLSTISIPPGPCTPSSVARASSQRGSNNSQNRPNQ